MNKLLVIGASRGIGLEWVRQACAAGDSVTATARDEAGLARLRALGAQALRLDLLDAASCAGLAWLLDGAQFDTAVVNAGVFGPRIAPPAVPSEADFQLVMQTNVLGPMRLLPTLQEALAPNGKLVFLSSGMAGVGARVSNSGWLYRASKAALNSVAKDTSLLLADRATVVALSPGWVKTDMGGDGAELEPDDALARMRRTVAALTPADTGRYLDLDGRDLPW
jgi:NAD(P)-dependent dehydrogenase (short-subunit alcohol dehydrogenase family)